jgi:tetratricopeptide (TPR) repeat protein
MALLREQERICRQLGNPQGLAVCLSGQASILQDRGDWDSALALLKEAERICRRLGSLDSLQACLGCQFSILQNHGDLDGGMALLKEQEQICRQIGNPLALKTALGGQAVIMVNRGDWDSALALLKEEERICRQLGNLVDLQHSLDFQASVLRSRGNLEDAIVLYKEHEEICRQLGKFDLLATTLGNRALTLMLLGRSEEGLPLAEEALRLANTHGYIEVAKQTTPIIDLLRQAALIHNPAPQHTHIPAATIASNDQTVSELRDSAATALKRGLWEAAETYLEKLLQQGEPLEIVAPDLITALLNAHETLSAATVTRIETLLAQLAAAGHTALVAELRQKLAAKQPKKSKWKFW